MIRERKHLNRFASILPAAAILAASSWAADGASAPQRWAFVPILMSNAETGLQGGLLALHFPGSPDTAAKPSVLGFAARFSQKGQVEVNLFPEWYLRGDLYHVAAEINYIRWPADFYGIGNASDIPADSADPYLAHGVNGLITVERQWLPGLFAGAQGLFDREEVESRGEPVRLDHTVPGSHGGLVNGLGAVMTYDGRDGVYWARRGVFLRARSAWYRGLWGSEYDFDRYSLEARQFTPLFATGALGLSATLQLKGGDVPFRSLSTPDGDRMMRGMVRGKYRDRHMLVVQGEYKSYLPDWEWLSPAWIRNRLGWAVFAEAGQVSRSVGGFAWDGFRPDVGLGIRYALNPAQRMNIRIDLGFVDGGVAPAINIKEAF